jgi:hypothetical protein
LRHDAAFVPGSIGGQNQRGHAAGIGARRFDCGGGARPHIRGAEGAAGKGGDGRCKPFDIGGQRRIQRAVIARLIADDVHHARWCAPGIMQVGQPVCEARPAMHQRRGGLAGDAVIGVGRTGCHRFVQTEHTAQPRDAVERRDKMHLAGAGIGEHRVDPRFTQGVDKRFGAIHADISFKTRNNNALIHKFSTGGGEVVHGVIHLSNCCLMAGPEDSDGGDGLCVIG